MTSPSVTPFVLAAALALVGCGGGAGSGSGTAETPTITERSTTGGEARPGSDDVGSMLVDVVVPRICDQLRGTFVGLPGEGGHEGPASGLDPTAGRWWIRQCTAHEEGGLLSLAIGGTGWMWTDRESMGFQVRQYLRFDATAAFRATMEFAYDREHRIVTVWMRPQGDVSAAVEPLGLVEARATNVVSGMLGGILEAAGSSASARARQQVSEEGSTRLRERFSAGFTVTYSMVDNQMDFMVGALDRGQIPERPYPADASLVWSVNQRAGIWPGGMDVIGPIDPALSQQSIELELEEGDALYVDAICATDFERFYDLSLQNAATPMPSGPRVIELAHPGPARASLASLSCPTLLVITPRAGTTLPVRFRTRIQRPAEAPREATATTTSDPQPSTTTTTVAPTGAPRPHRIRLQSLTVSTTSAAGAVWDYIGGEPDPYVVVVSVPGQREIERTAVIADRHEAPLDHWLPGAYALDDLPIRFTVYDDDVGNDELIGAAELTARDVSAGEHQLEIRTADEVPRTLGVLRVLVQPVM